MPSSPSGFDSPSARALTGHLIEAWMVSPPKAAPRDSPLAHRRRGPRGSRFPTPSQLEKVLRKHREEELFTYKQVRFKRTQGQQNVRRSEHHKSTRLNGEWAGASPASTLRVPSPGVAVSSSSSSKNRRRPFLESPAFRTDEDCTKNEGHPSDGAYSRKQLNLVFDESVSLQRRGELMAKFADALSSGVPQGETFANSSDNNVSWETDRQTRNDLTHIVPSDGDSGESELRRGRLPDASKKPYDALLRYVADTVHD